MIDIATDIGVLETMFANYGLLDKKTLFKQ